MPAELQAYVHHDLWSFQASPWRQRSYPHFKDKEARADWDWHLVENLPATAGGARDVGLIPGLERSPGEGNAYPLQYSCLKDSVDRGAWRATVHEVTKSRTWLNTHTHKLELKASCAQLYIFYFASHPLSFLRDLWGRGLTVIRLLMFRLSGRQYVVKLSGITPLRDDRTPWKTMPESGSGRPEVESHTTKEKFYLWAWKDMLRAYGICSAQQTDPGISPLPCPTQIFHSLLPQSSCLNLVFTPVFPGLAGKFIFPPQRIWFCSCSFSFPLREGFSRALPYPLLPSFHASWIKYSNPGIWGLAWWFNS